jgi:hypothetical protein
MHLILVIIMVNLFLPAKAGNIMIYPSPSCYKPSKPYTFSSEWEVENYKDKYNQYIDCMQSYIDDAYDDIRNIQNAISDAVREAESRY